jgi:hypothetical protein
MDKTAEEAALPGFAHKPDMGATGSLAADTLISWRLGVLAVS